MIGNHIIAEFYNCNPEKLENMNDVKSSMFAAAVEGNTTIIQECFHQFNPKGVTGVLVLAESHFSIHTWPEKSFAAVDIFTCSDTCDPMKAIEKLEELLECKLLKINAFDRGKDL